MTREDWDSLHYSNVSFYFSFFLTFQYMQWNDSPMRVKAYQPTAKLTHLLEDRGERSSSNIAR